MKALTIFTILALALSASARDSVVVFNEIHYHPAGDNSDLEFVELYNQLSIDVDLSQWRLDGDIQFHFPEGTIIGGGEYLVVASNPGALATASGYSNALGPFSGSLSNSGAPLLLYNNNRAYASSAPVTPSQPPHLLWSVDLQGDGNGGAFGQLAPPLQMSGLEANAGLGNVWNAFTLPGHSGTATNPALNLVDSAGDPSSVNFAIQGTVTGWSSNGSALFSDYLFINAGNSDSEITWKFSGLSANTNYSLYAYGGLSRDIKLTIDKNADGNLGDETPVVAPVSGLLIENISSDAAGCIVGGATNGTTSEGNWSGFQLFVPQVPVPPDDGDISESNEARRIMDELNYADTTPWPVGPDGSGATLAKRDPATSTEHPSNWRTSTQLNGTPGGPNTVPSQPTLTFNELTSTLNPVFRVELYNHGDSSIDLDDLIIASSDAAHADYILPPQTLLPGEFTTIDAATLGFTPGDNNRLFLFSADRSELIDAVRADDSPLARQPDGTGRWLHPDVATFGNANSFDLEDAIVINEIFYHAYPEVGTQPATYTETEEEWLELYNRSPVTVDLSGWAFTSGISYTFPLGTNIAAGEYLVVAKDAILLATKHPTAAIIGDYDGKLRNRGELILLEDAVGNPADEVRYHDSGKWHAEADGGGASLELRDPDADNSSADAWAPSDESSRSTWQTYTYEGTATNDNIGYNIYHEFLLCLLEAGEVLIDDVSVLENNSIEFIQNGDFQSDTIGAAPSKWRALGTHGLHGRTVVVADPDDPGNRCLRLVATGPPEDKHNKLETTFANGQQVVVGRTYTISYRAKWLSGSNQVNTRLYFNYLQRTTRVEVPDTWGTPGLANTAADLLGPTMSGLTQVPVVPETNQDVTISVQADDPDGISSLTLRYSVNGGGFQSTAMAAGPDASFSGTIPSQSAGRIIQFYIEARDTANTSTFLPTTGPAGGAFYKVQDGYADSSGLRHNFRIVMSEADRATLFTSTQRMSNYHFPVTVIEDEQVAYHNVGLRLKASGFGRFHSGHYGFNIRFQPDQLFRGVHKSISIERSPSLKELLAKHLMSQAGGGYWSFYDDVAYIITPTTGDRGVGLLSMARHTNTFFEGLFPDAETSGTLFNHELLYNPNGTTGGPEGLKVGNPYNHNNGMYDLEDRGLDKEPYRWGFQIRSSRGRDDYSRLIALNQAMELSGTALKGALDPIIDVDQWMRTFAMMSLNGTDDIYSRLYEHNFRYFVRPTDQKIIVLQWDLDRTFNLGTSSSVPPTNHSVTKLFTIPQYRRLFDGHLRDLIQTTFNSSYATSWASHFTTHTGDNLNGLPSYITSRANYVESQLSSPLSFEITTNGGNDFSQADSIVTLSGSGWIDVFSIEVNGSPTTVIWTDADSWEIAVPISIGLNLLSLEARNYGGQVVGTDTITVTNTSSIDLASANNTIISELHYHPATPSSAEITAGFTDEDDFEFIELTNISSMPVDLSGSRFTDGVLFDFPIGTVLAPGAHVLLVANQAAFEFRYGTGGTVAGTYTNQLKNSGERVLFEAVNTIPIADFTYGEDIPWPAGADGDGYSLILAGSDPANPLDWRMSTSLHGNPGTSDSSPFSGTPEELLSYALASPPAPTVSGDIFLFTLRHYLAADDAELSVEFSTDLHTWTTAQPTQLLSIVHQGDGTASQTWHSTLPLSTTTSQFARIRIIQR